VRTYCPSAILSPFVSFPFVTTLDPTQSKNRSIPDIIWIPLDATSMRFLNKRMYTLSTIPSPRYPRIPFSCEFAYRRVLRLPFSCPLTIAAALNRHPFFPLFLSVDAFFRAFFLSPTFGFTMTGTPLHLNGRQGRLQRTCFPRWWAPALDPPVCDTHPPAHPPPPSVSGPLSQPWPSADGDVLSVFFLPFALIIRARRSQSTPFFSRSF